ncbi:MAG: hypothetical protein AAGD34_15120 [Pseudomonadota bacterium]
MHTLLIIAGIAVGLFVWIRRIRRVTRAAGYAYDAAGSVRGHLNRRRYKRDSAFSPITAIDHPVVAAATLLAFVAGPSGWPKSKTRIRMQLGAVAPDETVESALTYAEWATDQGIDEERAVAALVQNLRDWLDAAERRKLAAMIDIAASSGDRRSFILAEKATRLLDATRLGIAENPRR